jgi:precorrin-2 dehydrogenase/sirohydrochlorin ferrochelatase
MTLFPMFLKLDGRACLVIGAGTIAAPKIDSLLRAGARVTVVAPEALPRVRDWSAESRLRWVAREFAASDLEGALLVVAATNVQSVNHAVAVAARALGILCNSVDDPPDCDFYYPSVVERGDLQIAVSTAGKSPALAQQLREELNALVDDDAGRWLDALGERRLRVLAALPAGEDRKQALHQLAQREACDPRDCPVERTLDRILQKTTKETR